MELNKIYCIDVLEGLRKLPSESIDLIITSPPYNKAGLNGKQKGKKWVGTIDYGGDIDLDNKPEDEYQDWMIQILNECFRVLKKDGSLFFNHKNRVIVGKGEISTPMDFIRQTPFKVRQEIIWVQSGSPNVHPSRYVPSFEQIYWLTKRKKVRFDRDRDCRFKRDVWKITPKKGTEHPAPFPIEIPDNIIPSVSQGKRITVLDPFMGSGTVAVSAIKNNCDFIGFELLQEYVDMTNNRIKNIEDEFRRS